MLGCDRREVADIVLVFVLAGFANFLGFLAIPASGSTRRMTLGLMMLGALFGIASIPTYVVAWATPHTVADLLFYCFFCIRMGLNAVAQLTRPAMKARDRSTPKGPKWRRSPGITQVNICWPQIVTTPRPNPASCSCRFAASMSAAFFSTSSTRWSTMSAFFRRWSVRPLM
jgi:hypothetical protein